MKKPIYLAAATLIITTGFVAGSYHKPQHHNSTASTVTATSQADPIQPATSSPSTPAAQETAAPATAPAAATSPSAPSTAAPSSPPPASSPTTQPVVPTPHVIGDSLRYQASTTKPDTQDAYCTYRFDDASQVDKYIGSRPTPGTGHGNMELECPSWRG